MIDLKKSLAVLAVLALLLLLACGDADAEPGLTADEVREIVRAELAEAPAPSQPGTGVTSAEAERIARGVVASIPLKTSPADYTAFFVDSAIARYETRGLDATLAHYSRQQSIDGQWYVFIVGEDGRLIAHPNPYRLGLDLKGWVGTDANGYNYAPEVLSATGEGKWVTYVYRNPESGASAPATPASSSSRTSGWCGTTGCCSAPAGTSTPTSSRSSWCPSLWRNSAPVGWRGPWSTSPTPEAPSRA